MEIVDRVPRPLGHNVCARIGFEPLDMKHIQGVRQKIRSELEAPPALRAFGTGWISGVLGLVLGIAGLLMVMSLRAPGLFTMPELNSLYANPWFRFVLHLMLIASF